MMSGFEAHLRRRLAAMELASAPEWDRAVLDPDVRNALGRIGSLGGDPNFCLFLAATYRWRRLTLLKGVRSERARLLKALTELLRAKGELGHMLIHRRPERGQMLEEIRAGLLSATGIDEGLTGTTTTTSLREGDGPQNDHQSICLSLVDRHLKHATRRDRTHQTLLVEFLQPFGLVPERSLDAERWVEKRLERCRGEVRLPLLPFYDDYHAEHLKAALDCTKACELARAFGEDAAMSAELKREIYLGSLVKFTKAPHQRSPH